MVQLNAIVGQAVGVGGGRHQHTSGMRIRLRPEGSGDDNIGWGDSTGEGRWTIKDISIAYGGVTPVMKLARGAMSYMVGKTFREETLVGARRALLEEFDMPGDIPEGQAQYRMTLAAKWGLQESWRWSVYSIRRLHRCLLNPHSITSSFRFGQLLAQVLLALHCQTDEGRRDGSRHVIRVDVPTARAGDPDRRGRRRGIRLLHGVQTYPAPRIAVGLEGRTSTIVAVLPRPKAAMDAANGVGMLTRHAPGPLHCTGEALYADDIPATEDLLHGNLLIMSTRCHTRLVSINVALTAPSRMMTSSGWAGKIVWGPSSLTTWRLSHWGTRSSTSGRFWGSSWASVRKLPRGELAQWRSNTRT